MRALSLVSFAALGAALYRGRDAAALGAGRVARRRARARPGRTCSSSRTSRTPTSPPPRSPRGPRSPPLRGRAAVALGAARARRRCCARRRGCCRSRTSPGWRGARAPSGPASPRWRSRRRSLWAAERPRGHGRPAVVAPPHAHRDRAARPRHRRRLRPSRSCRGTSTSCSARRCSSWRCSGWSAGLLAARERMWGLVARARAARRRASGCSRSPGCRCSRAT